MEIEVALKDIKNLELAEINQAFLDDLGFENEEELRDALREQMVERIDYDVQQAMREQVTKHLLDNDRTIDLPAKLSGKQADRVVSRRAMDLMMRGMRPRADRGQHRAAARRRRRRSRPRAEAVLHPPEARPAT